MMKFIRLPYLGFFVLFLLFGFWSGRQTTALASQFFGNNATRNTNFYPIPKKESLNVLSTNQNFLSVEASEDNKQVQRNILFIGVDEIQSSQPKLEGIWLLLYIEGTSHLTFMPVYPGLETGIGDQRGNLENAIEKTFQLTQEKQPAPEFLANLRVRSLWWDGFIILDKTALSQLVDNLGGILMNSTDSQNGTKAIGSLPSVGDNPQGALRTQAMLIQGFCYKASQPPEHSDKYRLLERIQGHLVSDIDLEPFLNRWLAINPGNSIFCEFPSLAAGFNQP